MADAPAPGPASPSDGGGAGPKRSMPAALSLSAIAAAAAAAPPRPLPPVPNDGAGTPPEDVGPPASTWSSPATHGVRDDECGAGADAGADAAAAASDHLDDLAGLDLAASWGAAVEAAVAGLACPSTAPASLAALVADPHAPADLVESPTAWAGLLACLPGLLGDVATAEAGAALVAAVASTAALEAPALLPALAAAAVGGLEGGDATAPPPAVACITSLLSHTLPRSWGPFTPPMLAVAAGAVGRAIARTAPDGAPSPALASLAGGGSAAWLRRWAATPRVAGALWEAVSQKDGLRLHERAVAAGGEGRPPPPPALAVSATLVSAAVATRAGRAQLADPAAAVAALARLCGSSSEAVADAATAGLTALAGCWAEPATASLFTPPALAALVDGGAAPVLAALASTPAGVDAILRAVVSGGESETPWPTGGPSTLLPAVAADAVRSDPLGRLHLAPRTTPGALAAAAASRAPPGLVALAQAGADPAALADGWLAEGGAWVPPPPPAPPPPTPAAWRVCAAAAALVELHPAAVGAAVAAAIAGTPPAFTGPPTPSPPPPVEAVAALYAEHGEAIARLV